MGFKTSFRRFFNVSSTHRFNANDNQQLCQPAAVFSILDIPALWRPRALSSIAGNYR
jgi:hypothetical protein